GCAASVAANGAPVCERSFVAVLCGDVSVADQRYSFDALRLILRTQPRSIQSFSPPTPPPARCRHETAESFPPALGRSTCAVHRLMDAKSPMVLFLQTVSFLPLLPDFVPRNQRNFGLRTSWQRSC
ncbi:MAG TPA: hypothetical protein VFR76_00145, partial [Verrucomicrobiae bacterium]|nr:hypothetical protein [Verrucomicrobiae bacterium]